MTTILQIMAIVPLLMTSAVGQGISCQTILGTKSIANVPSATTTITNARQSTQTLFSQQTTTIYVPFVTTTTRFTTNTITETDTTQTDTFSTTSTVFNVQTITDTETVTTTSTSTSTTSSTSTTTIATTAGFKNIMDTLNSDTLPLNRRAAGHPHADPKPVKRAVLKGAQGVLAQSYPAKVTCTSTAPNRVTKTVYSTLPRATRTVNYWAWTVIQVNTIMTTTTIVPAHVSTTLTDFSTSSVTTFTTVFATSTVPTVTVTTNVLSGPTLYDACLPQNTFGPNFSNSNKPYYAVNVANNGPGVASDFKTVADGASTAVECCSACQRLSTCETFIFRARNRNCFLLYHDGATCNSQFNHPNFILSKSGSDTGAGYVVGNGNCGYTYSGNSDGSVFPVQ